MQSFLGGYPEFVPDTPLLFAGPAPDTWLSFFLCNLMSFKCITNTTLTAFKHLCHFGLICIWMFCHISFQLFRIYFSKSPMQLFFSQIARFLPLLFPFSYRCYGYLKYLVCFLQRMPVLPIFYCPFPVFF